MLVRERTKASVVSMVPMGILMKSTNSFTLWRVAPLRVVLEALTSPATASVAAHGHVDRGGLGRIESETAAGAREGGTGSTTPAHPTDPHLYNTVALFQHPVAYVLASHSLKPDPKYLRH